MPRDRDGYDVTDLSIRKLIEADVIRGHNAVMWAAMGAMTLDGRPLIDEPYRVRTNSVHDIRLAATKSEVLMAARALLLAGERDVAFLKSESPDFIATLADGRVVGVEVTEVIAPDSAHRENAMLDLNILLKEAVDADESLWPAYTYIAFNFAPFTEELPDAAERAAIVDEITTILRNKSWVGYKGPPFRAADPDSSLDRFGIWLHVGELPRHPRGHVEVYGAATTFDESSLADVAKHRLKKKIETASKPHFRKDIPLWLVMGVTDPFGFFSPSLATFGNAGGPIAPFARVLFNYGSQQLVLEAA